MHNEGDIIKSVNIIYLYDGSFDGLLCCIHESLVKKEIPFNIIPLDKEEPTFMFLKVIESNSILADNLYNSIVNIIGNDAFYIVKSSFFSCIENKEMAILNFILIGYKEKRQTMKLLANSHVNKLLKAVHNIEREAEKFIGFIRFSDSENMLTSKIAPKNFILPFISKHFITRYNNENFIIYDEVHNAALVYQNHIAKVISAEDIVFPLPSAAEEEYQRLWRQFYNTISIKARENPKGRLNHMPKRYWGNLTEMQ